MCKRDFGEGAGCLCIRFKKDAGSCKLCQRGVRRQPQLFNTKEKLDFMEKKLAPLSAELAE